MFRKNVWVFVRTVGLCGWFSLAQAAGYPEKPVKLVVPFAAGGTTDIVARAVATRMGQSLGQPVTIENRVGVGGVLGSNIVAKASPDGYVLGMATVSSHASNPAINPNMPYDPVKDFSPITNMAATPNVIAIHPAFPARDYADFMATLLQSPGQYSYASSGVGGIGHMQMELFKRITFTVLKHVPYNGAGQALSDTASGKVPIIFDNLPSALPYVLQGRLVPIAVAAPQRLAVLPKVPTFVELGLDPVNRMAFYGLVGPKGLPVDVVEKVRAAALAALRDPEVRAKIEATGSVVNTTTALEFATQIEAEYGIYKKVAKDRRLKFTSEELAASTASAPVANNER